MNAHSAARAAGLVLLAGLAAGNVGCKHVRRAVDVCLPPAECDVPCPPDAKSGHRKVVGKHHAPAVRCETPAVKCDADCAPSVVEVRQPSPIHVKVPQQDVVVNLPPQAPPVPPAAPPMQPVQPMAGGFLAPAAAGFVPADVTHVPASRARLGFAFDTVRIRIPIIRPVAIPTVPEMTVSMPVAPVAAPQMQFVQPQAVQQAAFVQPQAAFVQPQAAFVQPQAVAPQMQLMPVAPAAPQQMQLMPVAPTAPVAPAAPSQQSVEDYCRQVDALMRALEASKRAAGCPPLNPPAR